MRRIFIDTEWTAVPWSSDAELLWIGLADEGGQTFCALSSEARVQPSNEEYVAALLKLLTPDVPRHPRRELAAAVVDFCAQVDEFWVWIPTPERFAEWSQLGDAALETYKQCRDVDLQMLRALVKPWPKTWPNTLHDLNAAAVSAGVEIPQRAANYLHPRVHAEWNRRLFSAIQAAGRSSAA